MARGPEDARVVNLCTLISREILDEGGTQVKLHYSGVPSL